MFKFLLAGAIGMVAAVTVAVVGYEAGYFDSFRPAKSENQVASSSSDGAGVTGGQSELPKSPITAKDSKSDRAAPTFDVVRVEPSGDAVVAGLSEPRDEISLLANGQVIGKTRSNASGEWAIVLETPLRPGDYDVSVEAHDDNGKSTESKQRVTVSIPADKNSGDVLVVMNAEGEPSTILQKPGDLQKPGEMKVAAANRPQKRPDQAASDSAQTAVPSKQTETAEPPVQAETAEPSVQTETAEPSVQTETAEPSVQTETAEPSVQAETAEPSVQAETAEPSVQAETAEPSVQTETAEPSVVGAASQEEEKPAGEVEIGQAANAGTPRASTTQPMAADAAGPQATSGDSTSHDTSMHETKPGGTDIAPANTTIQAPSSETRITENEAVARTTDSAETTTSASPAKPDTRMSAADAAKQPSQDAVAPAANEHSSATIDDMSPSTSTGPGPESARAPSPSAAISQSSQAASPQSMATPSAPAPTPAPAPAPAPAMSDVTTADASKAAPASTQDEASAPSATQGENVVANAQPSAPSDESGPSKRAAADGSAADGTTDATADSPVPDTVKTAETTSAQAAVTASEPEPVVGVDAVESENGKLFVAGKANPGASVRIYFGKDYVGEATAGPQGRWLLETERAVKPGTHDVRADLVRGEAGDVMARAQVTFEREPDEVVLTQVTAQGSTTKPSTASGTVTANVPNIIIRPGDNLWRISRRLYGHGIRYTTIYKANQAQIRDPDLIYPGQIFVTPVGDKNWDKPKDTSATN